MSPDKSGNTDGEGAFFIDEGQNLETSWVLLPTRPPAVPSFVRHLIFPPSVLWVLCKIELMEVCFEDPLI